ncbi:hypothetical protein GCM10022252_73380 [Streptosporangium oxazolinicum]|uniref:Uncharacterized protein n=1 Tax=Streptosporangium oxazolinicum TaxID=909287 RepID=A0ABP8BJE7_9ACTN
MAAVLATSLAAATHASAASSQSYLRDPCTTPYDWFCNQPPPPISGGQSPTPPPIPPGCNPYAFCP